MIHELRQYLRDIHRSFAAGALDILIIARDANCKGVPERKRELEEEFQKWALPLLPIYAVPDPHIERWLLLDAQAFKHVLGKGCQAPDKKCERGRYKRLLGEAVREAGLSPIFHGMEHAEAIINEMDMQQVSRLERSFGQLVEDLTMVFNQWKQAGT
jgi:RNase P protein component